MSKKKPKKTKQKKNKQKKTKQRNPRNICILVKEDVARFNILEER